MGQQLLGCGAYVSGGRLISLGIDPGTRSLGFALVERISSFTGKWIEAGNLPTTYAESAALLVRLKPDLVVVEEPVWIGLGKGAAELFKTCWVGGGWHWLAQSNGIRAEAIYAREWRLWLCNDASPSNADIASHLPRVITGIPKRSNNHERDACGIAWAGLRLPENWTEMRRRTDLYKAKLAGLKSQNRKRMKVNGRAA